MLALLADAPEDRDRGLATDLLDVVLRHVLHEDPPSPDVDHVSTAVTLRADVSRLAVLTDAERGLLAEWLDRVIAAG